MSLSSSCFVSFFFLSSRYRNRSFNLKTAFHAFETIHRAKVASGTFPFFLFRLSTLSLPFRYIFARFLHSSSFEPSEKGFESLLSFLVFHGLMLPDQRLVAGIRIYLRTPREMLTSGEIARRGERGKRQKINVFWREKNHTFTAEKYIQ